MIDTKEEAIHEVGSLIEATPEFYEKVDTLTEDTLHLISELPYISPGLQSALRLQTFNTLLKGPSIDDIDTLGNHLASLVDKDYLYSHPGNPLPTVGIEVECSRTDLTSPKIYILEKLEIPNYEESAFLHEVNPSFSYHPLVQARMIWDLASMRAIHLVPITSHKVQIPDREAISMHVNFGIPSELKSEVLDEYQSEISAFVNMFTFAYSTPERLLNRKTKTSVDWDDEAESTAKNTMLPTLDENGELSRLLRLEVRTAEVRDRSAYFFMHQGQLISASLFSSLKMRAGCHLSQQEQKLAMIWGKRNGYSFSEGFVRSAYELLFEYKSPYRFYSNLLDDDKETAAALVRETDISERCQALIEHYSIQVKKIISQ